MPFFKMLAAAKSGVSVGAFAFFNFKNFVDFLVSFSPSDIEFSSSSSVFFSLFVFSICRVPLSDRLPRHLNQQPSVSLDLLFSVLFWDV